MTEAKDDVSAIKRMLDEQVPDRYYIHSDAAMSGSIAPFLNPRPHFDFADGANSISISGHKFIGCPIPCGLVFAQKENTNKVAREIEYIGNLDTTISGSRNGLTPLALWCAMKALGTKGMQERVDYSLELSAFLVSELNEIGVSAWRNQNAITVVMPKLSTTITNKWQLAVANDITHVITMPNLTKNQLSLFLDDVQCSVEQTKQCAKIN